MRSSPKSLVFWTPFWHNSTKLVFSSQGLDQVFTLIHNVIDFDAPGKIREIPIQSGVHPSLDSLRERADQLPDLLDQIMQTELQHLPEISTLPFPVAMSFVEAFGFLVEMQYPGPKQDFDGKRKSSSSCSESLPELGWRVQKRPFF